MNRNYFIILSLLIIFVFGCSKPKNLVLEYAKENLELHKTIYCNTLSYVLSSNKNDYVYSLQIYVNYDSDFEITKIQEKKLLELMRTKSPNSKLTIEIIYILFNTHLFNTGEIVGFHFVNVNSTFYFFV